MSDQNLYKCGTCKEMLTGDRFYWRKKGRNAGKRVSPCKSCNAEKVRLWCIENRDGRRLIVWKYDEKHRDRLRSYHRKYRAKMTDDQKRAPHLKRMYGMTLREYTTLLLRQGGTCALCPATKARPSGGYLCVDHDHNTGAVRGLLCSSCNTAIGLLGDDPKRLLEAAKYLSTDNVLTRMLAGA